MPDWNRGLLQLTRGGIPWAIDPRPRSFLLPERHGVSHGLVLEANAAHPGAGWERLGCGSTRHVAAALDGDGDVVTVGARVRYDIDSKRLDDRKLHEIFAANDSQMRRNGEELLAFIAEAVRVLSERNDPKLLQAVVRFFPCVALRHERVAAALDRLADSDNAIRRWFGMKAGKGRPARPIPEAAVVIGTMVHECSRDENETVDAALARMERAGLGERKSLANLKSRESELYRLDVGGVWVKADRLLRLPWVPPKTAELRWNVYRFPA